MKERIEAMQKLLALCMECTDKGLHMFFTYDPHCGEHGCYDVSYHITGKWKEDSEAVWLECVKHIEPENIERTIQRVRETAKRYGIELEG